MSFYKYVWFCLILFSFNLMFCSSIYASSEVLTGQDNVNSCGCLQNQSIMNPFFKAADEDCDLPVTEDCDLPVAPELNKFDKAVLNVCGGWVNTPRADLFKVMLDNTEYKEYVDKLYEGLNHQVFTPNASLEKFKDELTKLWFGQHAFAHIMCGQPGELKLGGMHFFGRYIQAQENNWAGRHYDSTVIDEVSDKVYTIGVIFRNSNNHLAIDPRKGCDFTHADEILLNATKAYKEFSKHTKLSDDNLRKCLYRSNGVTYTFVAKNNAIFTFYSTLTPMCDPGETECNCVK
ncbi:EndoU domain-containing protein [Ehrlichia sp. JZT12]